MTTFNRFNYGGFGGGGTITSVNGNVGPVVVLTAADVGAQAASAVLAAYAGGDTPSAFTLGIVDSADAAAWRAAIGAGTSSVVGANPSASVGLAAVNGVAATFMRSDGAPALDQNIAPTWTAQHTFSALSLFNNEVRVQDASVAKLSLYIVGTERALLTYTTATDHLRLDSDGTLDLAANNAIGLTLTPAASPQALFNAGTAALPSMSIIGDPNTGIYSFGADDLGFAAGGAVRMDLSTTALNMAVPVIFAAGSASANTWPKLTAGTLLTTAENGALEMDTKAFYVTTIAGNRGVVPNWHFIRQNSTYTLANVGTAQQAFNSVTNGRLTLGTGTYFFEAMFNITGMSATSGNLAFQVLGAGTAVTATFLYLASGVDGGAGTAAGGGFCGNVANTSANPIVPAGTSTSLNFMVRGSFKVTTAGTIIPSLTLANAVGTAVVAAGSYFFCNRVGDVNVVSCGAWD